MPPPPDRLQDIWARTIEESPDLRDRWGGATEFPIDDQGNIDRDALRDLLSATRGREVPQKSYAVTPPRPVDWGQRIKDLTGAVRFLAEPGQAQIGGLLGTTPFAKFIPGIEPAKAIQAPEKWNTVGALSTALSATGQMMEPISKGLQAVDEIVAPARGMAFGGWVPGLTKPGVQARSRALREQGFGPWASAGAAYEQSVEAGEIPWWQRLPAEILTDPVELAPGIGIGPGIAKLGYRGLTGLTKAVVPKVAKEAVEAVPGSVPGRAAPTAPADARAAVPGDVPRRVPVEEAAKLAEVRAIGPRAKIAILEERHREALEAIRNLEARIPQAQRQLDIPTTRPAAPAAAPAAGVPAAPAPTVPQLSTKTGALRDRIIRNDAEFFLETVDDQLAVVRSTEKSARIALQDAQARVRLSLIHI